MAQVSLQVNGYGYTLGCGDGEETHLLTLAADLDRRIQEIKHQVGPTGEARMLLMAALMLADELHDLHAERGIATPPKTEPKIGRRLRGLTRKAESIAAATEEALPLPAEPVSSGKTVAATTDQT
jgi:cell division protein ZapA